MGLVACAKQILLAPDEAWREIGREPISPLSLLFNYALPLAAIGPAAFAARIMLLETAAPPVSGLALIVAGTALNLAAAASVAIAAMFVASAHCAKRDFRGALAVSFYSATSVWIASVSVLVPGQAVFAIVFFGGLVHSLYLFYLGLIAVLKVPDEDAGIATADHHDAGAGWVCRTGMGVCICYVRKFRDRQSCRNQPPFCRPKLTHGEVTPRTICRGDSLKNVIQRFSKITISSQKQ